MGNIFNSVSHNATVIAASDLWIEGAAVQQLVKTSQLPGMVRAVGMPDLHPGRGYPIGATFFSSERFYPALVGGDIGCGVTVWNTEIPASKYKLDKLDRIVGNLDEEISKSEMSTILSAYPALSPLMDAVEKAISDANLDLRFLSSIGSIGSGNHFAEIQRLEEYFGDASQIPSIINKKCLSLVVHSGSRGLGGAILRDHVEVFGHSGLVEGSDDARSYLVQHAAAVRYAELNRRVIAARLFARLGVDATLTLDVNHNTVTRETFDNVVGWVHRKGATPMTSDYVMIPGSRDNFSYLVRPLAEASSLSLGSLAHGAGRKWQRADCKGRLFGLLGAKDLSRGALGSRVICNSRDLIYEEAGAAYKPIDSVIRSLAEAGLVEVVATYRPVLTYKTRGECC
jgi:release factor H-coupled RctB family protein